MNAKHQSRALVAILFLAAALIAQVSADPLSGNSIDSDSKPLGSDSSSGYNSDSDSTTIVEAEYQGVQCRVPVYEEGKIFTQARLEFDRKIVSEILEFFAEVSENLLAKNKSMLIYGTKNIRKLLNMFTNKRDRYQAFCKQDSSSNFRPNFAASMGQMVKLMTDAKAPNSSTGVEAHELALKAMGCAQALVDASPVGIYLNWGQSSIDGENIVHFLAPLVTGIRNSVRRPLLMVFRQIGDMLSNTKL